MVCPETLSSVPRYRGSSLGDDAEVIPELPTGTLGKPGFDPGPQLLPETTPCNVLRENVTILFSLIASVQATQTGLSGAESGLCSGDYSPIPQSGQVAWTPSEK